MRAHTELDAMQGMRRTHPAREIVPELIGREVVLTGWVHRRRDHGGVIFVDLRDRGEIVQVVFKPELSPETHARAGELRSEYVILVRGEVRRRSDDTINPKMATGEVEVDVLELKILNRATPPPFPIEDEIEADEATRLRHRIHDLRRGPLQRALTLRHNLYQSVRRTLTRNGFLEIETPFLAKSTPEGARDFLVPSRLQHGAASTRLPQSPQILKQMLMIAGFERYFQIVTLLPGRGSAGRPPARVHPDRHGDVLRTGVEDVLEACWRRSRPAAARDTIGRNRVRAAPFHRITYRGGDGPLRDRQVRIPASIARALSISRTSSRDSEFQGFSRRTSTPGASSSACTIPEAAGLCRAARSIGWRSFVKQGARRQGSRLDPHQRATGSGSRRSSSSSPNRTRSESRSPSRDRGASGAEPDLLPGRRSSFARERASSSRLRGSTSVESLGRVGRPRPGTPCWSSTSRSSSRTMSGNGSPTSTSRSSRRSKRTSRCSIVSPSGYAEPTMTWC